MKIFKEEYKDEQLALSFMDTYFKGKKYAIFDIETTGLSPKNCQVILTGFVVPKGDGNYEMIQYFAESLSDEASVLMYTADLLNQMDYVITFNGKGFDMPFIEKRMDTLNINSLNKAPKLYNLDIYKIVKSFSDIKKFVPNLKQKTLENFLGLYETRSDQIDGGKSVDQYFEYLVTKDPNLESTILLHNRDDVMQLNRLCNILKKVDFHKAMAEYGFPLEKTTIDNLKLTKNQFKITGNTCLSDALVYDDSINLKLNITERQLQLTLKVYEKENLFFVDLRDLGLNSNLLDYFRNCNGLYLDHFLMLKVDGEINYKALNLLGKYLIERIELNEN